MKLREKLSGKEASGALTLIFVILFIQTVIFIFNKEEPKTDSLSEIPVVKKGSESCNTPVMERVIPEKAVVHERKKRVSRPDSVRRDELFQFDPNIATLSDFTRLGLTTGQASVILKYRERGGVFRRVEDFKKIYVLPDGFYERVKDYIIIERSHENQIVELNGADSLTLLTLPGIGPFYASRILDFRRRTGGFAYPEQLLDIKGMDPERFNGIKNRIIVDSNLIVKREIAALTQNELSSNPYIGHYLARTIVRYLETYKDKPAKLFNLEKNNVINGELLRILLHYFH